MVISRRVGLIAVLFASLYITTVKSQSSSNRCDRTRSESINTDCISCRQNIKVSCPSGFRKTSRGKGRRGCRYRIQAGSTTRPARGCQHTCIRVIRENECCDGYWGQDCQACPRDRRGAVCSARGICSDKISGNGTCQCRGNIGGSACEVCKEPNQYGSNCEQTCACIHGRCDSGVGRPGTCSCESGYGGALCGVVLADCATHNCPTNSRCLRMDGQLQCRCNPGYDGDQCEPINPCDDSAYLCSPNATCSHTGPAKYSCSCNPGYSGDGKWCEAIDPCQTNNGGCPVNTTTCKYTGPGQSNCQCKAGYQNLTTSGCSLADVCGLYSNTTCDAMANCTTVDNSNFITVKCSCPIGFLSVGLHCYGDLFTEMQKANESGPFANQLNMAIAMFESTYFQDLFFSSTPYTLLAPQDGAFGSELGQPNSSEVWKARARAHIVPTQVIVDFQAESAKSMYPLLGSQFSIKALRPLSPDPNPDDESSGVFAQLNFANSYRTGGMLASNLWASNGVFYVIDTVMEPPDTFPIAGFDGSSMSLLQVLRAIPDASSFLQLWQLSYITRDWLRASSFQFSLLVPSNDAFAALSVDQQKALNNELNRNKLDMLLRHHVVQHSYQSTTLAAAPGLETSADSLPVNVSDSSGLIMIGNGAKILVSEVAISGGSNIYIIDKVLIPEFVKPLVKNWCTSINQQNTQGPCQACTTTLTCPEGGQYQTRKLCAREVETISGTSSSISNKFGCRAVCLVNVSTSFCCMGYFGLNCQSCPGPVGNQCNGNGVCDDGMRGSGVCSCNPGFTGPDCSVCSQPNVFGPGCDINCTCAHGTCVNQVNSRGICVAGSCEDGWAGENCDRRALPCGAQGLTCHQHARCVEVYSVQRCVCEPGYSGEGLSCVEFNPCTDSDDRGGCDRNGVCLYYGGGNSSCTCKEHYLGDGKTCTAVNPCHLNIRGRCHQHATCIFTQPGFNDCSCNDGYRGSGFVCTEINSCLENNGGCHGRASCTKTGPGTNDCSCISPYVGDGRQCVGSIMLEISEHPELTLLKHWAETVTSVQSLFYSLRNFPHVTVFLPRNKAWNSMKPSDYQFWTNTDHLADIISHHVVIGDKALPSYLLKGGTKLETLLPTTFITVTNQTSGVTEKDVGGNATYTEMIPTLGSNYAKIVIPDLRIFNGVVHVIDDVLLPPRDAVHNYTSLADAVQNSTGTDLSIFSVFLNSLNSTGVVADILSSGKPYTIFALSNEYFDPTSLPTNARLVMQYHVILGKLIRLSEVQSGQHESTLAGTGYQVTLTRMHGRVSINSEETTLTDVRTQKGIVHGFREVPLTPQKSRCDKTRSSLFRTPCLPCLLNFPCPNESPSSMVHTAHCYFRGFPFLGHSRTGIGCRKLCWIKSTKAECCTGFYGNDCEPCPGGVGNSCFKQGTCFDGVAGNGTCACTNSKFAGLACDDCAPGLFGSDCRSKCNCVNGTCDSGMRGTGKCVCSLGYTGTQCDQLVQRSDACNGACDSSAVCTMSIPSPKCVCASGYSGDGTTCTPINPCDADNFHRCHAYASCVHRGPDQYECKCKDGFQGDGTYCYEINPCQGNATDCDKSYGLCHHTGPNQYNCICRDGYSGDGKLCFPVDPCTIDNGGCHPFATCLKSGPGTRTCTCYANQIGDGITSCIGSIYQEYLNDDQLTCFLQGSMVRSILDSPGPLTVFLPYIPTSQVGSFTRNDTQFFLNHIVGCGSYNVTDLQRAGTVKSMVGNPISMELRDGSVYINGVIKLGKPRLFANGLAYRINQTIQAPRPISDTAKNQANSNAELLQNLGFSEFVKLLNGSGILNVLGQRVHGRWTLFIPTNDAFNNLSTYKRRQLANDNDVAQEYAKYHLVRQSFLSPSDVVVTQQELTTMQGSDITMSCSADSTGTLLLNGAEAKVVRFLPRKLFPTNQMMTSALYVIDKVLHPPSVGGRCDVTNNVTILSGCTFCHSVMGCPTGMAQVGIKRGVQCNAMQSSGSRTSFSGCQSICSTYNITKKCCTDFYGKDCHPCPGGIDNACNHNGRCDQGINGTGKCTCDQGFKGYACEQCQTGRYGFQCETCKCSLHGKCNEGLNGDGRCFCDEGYTGDICDKKLVHPANCSNECVANAVCVEGGTCVCLPGYQGFGNDVCEVRDLCQEKPNGGCSPHALCVQINTNVTCTCKDPYVGDGFVCEGTDPCNDVASAPICHSLARCVYAGPGQTRCECLPGYRGNGVDQCELDSQWTQQENRRCAASNGGCSENAICVDLPQTALQQTAKVKCSCKKGYVGDGLTCNGNVFQVLSQASYQMGKFYQKIIRSGNMQLMYNLRNAQNLTLFVPENKALSFRRLKYKVLKRHILTGHSYTTTDLRGLDVVVSDSREPLPIQQLGGQYYVSGVRITNADIIATNGVIHTIETVLPAKPQKISTTTSTVASPAVSPGKTSNPRTPTKPTPKTKTPMGGGGVTTPVKTPTPSNASTPAGPKVTKKPVARASNNGVKVGVAVAIVFLVLIAVVLVYWKRRSAMFVFRPLSQERARLTSSRSEDAFDDPVPGIGMMNPAYDSTGFSGNLSGAAADEAVTLDPVASPLEAEERAEEEALIAFNDINE